MSSKLIVLRSLLLKNSALFFLLISLTTYSQVTITEIHTDWKGYWRASSTTGVGNRPDDYNNLLAFKWKTETYSTGVNDNILTAKGVSFNAQKFRALKIGSLGYDNSTYILQGSMIDNDATKAILNPALAGTLPTAAEMASRLTDGSNGLSLGTGVANIKGGSAEFKIGTNNLTISGLDDGIPDLIITQVADPGSSSSSDVFKFVDSNGATVGNDVSVAFGAVNAVGTYSLDLFKADGGANPFSPASTRDIRLVGIETKAFGITSANAHLVDRFVINFSGSSDCAFIAFNSNSLKIAELSLVKTATMSSCGKEGDVINYNFKVKNMREVPVTDISISDPGVVFSGNYIASLAPLEERVITGKYVITATDVANGKVVNSAKVTGMDPSLNVVEDISGTDEGNNIETTTILLAPPTIGTITPASCSALGKVVLNNLPSSGTWTLTQSGKASDTKTGSGNSFTVENLAVGTYQFRVRNSTGCLSPLTIDVVITDKISTTWNGTTWSNDPPTATTNVIINSVSPNQPFTSDITICSLTVNSVGNVVIPTGVTLTVTNAITSNGKLVFQNNSSLMQSATAVNTGNITYKRIAPKIRQADFVYWSTPVNPQTLIGVSPLTASDKYYYNNAPGWIEIDRNSTMAIGKGYIIRGPENFSNTAKADYEASFVGVPNNGTYTTPSLTVARYHLLGNPYPSALSVDLLTAGNSVLNGTVYLWTHNTGVDTSGSYGYNPADYASYNGTGSVATTGNASNINEKPTGFIGAGQAFFVSTKATGTVVFNNSMRAGGTNNSQFFKSTTKEAGIEKNRVWLNMTNAGGLFKQLLVGYVEGATNGYENRFDGITMDANSYLDFYSIMNSNKFVIQGRALPFTDTDLVPLGYRTTIAGDFTIAIDEVDGKMSDQKIYIEDKTTGVVHDLTQSNYTFKTEAGTFTDRLILRYTGKTLGTGDFENIQDGILVSVKNKVINILSSKENIKEVTVYDVSGKLLYNKKKVGSTELQIQNLPSSNQVLLVKITLANDFTTTRKIIFQ